MRIIDKNYDYYDYLQSYNDTLVFDRRNSFILTKEDICNALNYTRFRYKYLLLQCGATYWVFGIDITEVDNFKRPTNFTIKLIDSWKDYKKPRVTVSVKVFSFWDYNYSRWILKESYLDYFNLTKTIIKGYKDKYTEECRKIPLLKATGIIEFIPAVEIFSAIEEGLGLDKTEVERTEPIGATNNDKIIMHGFDVKDSFRGKR